MEIGELKQLFALCDSGSKGFLTQEELCICLSGVLGFVPEPIADQQTQTSLGQFIARAHRHLAGSNHVAHAALERRQDMLRSAFLVLDARCQGTVSWKDHPVLGKIKNKEAMYNLLGSETIPYRKFSVWNVE